MPTSQSRTCSSCGAPFEDAGICPFCSTPINLFFANRELVEKCIISLKALQTEIDNIPPAEGWGVMVVWFGAPPMVVLLCGLLIQTKFAWMIGLLSGAVLFLVLTPLIAKIRENIRLQQIREIVLPQLGKMIKDPAVRDEDLILLVKQNGELMTNNTLLLLLDSLRGIE